jgi:hypothetical protein
MEIDARRMDRAFTNLRAIIQVKESSDSAWKEVTNVTSVSRNGLSLTLSRPCTVGRLVNVVLPMPKECRSYDHAQELYQVVGIVQYCNPSNVDGVQVFHAGLGLIGKEVPPSFIENPGQNYRISGMTSIGLWSVTEAVSQFKHRRNPRHWVSLPVTVSLIHRKDEPVRTEKTATRNVSLTGMSISTKLRVDVGNKVRIACEPLDFHAIAIVRAVKQQTDGSVTMHVELDGHRFPVDKIAPASPTS